jgi:hypothetical protein
MSLLIGTNSVSSNAVYKVNVFLPTDESIMDTSVYSENKPETSAGSIGYVGTMGQQKLNITMTLSQNAEIMKAKICKSDPNNN